MKSPKFENLFVLELANNHWGNLEIGLKIHSIILKYVVKHNNVKAAIKFQIRDVDNFVHSNYRNHPSRYISKNFSHTNEL